MRITIELDGVTLQQQAGVRLEHQEPVPQPQPQPEPRPQKEPERMAEDINAGPPPDELLDLLALEGGLEPIMRSFQPMSASQALSAGGPAAEPVRASWAGNSVIGRRRG